jgi:hypothetical protein
MIRLEALWSKPIEQIEDEWPAIDLQMLEIAERVCPFGERAQTLRAMYLAHAFAASQGSKDASRIASGILEQLLPDG